MFAHVITEETFQKFEFGVVRSLFQGTILNYLMNIKLRHFNYVRY